MQGQPHVQVQQDPHATIGADGQPTSSSKNFGVHTLNKLLDHDLRARANATRPNISLLALGIDLNSLDLKIASPQPLHPQLGTVWTSQLPQDCNRLNNDTYTPTCYDVRPHPDPFVILPHLDEATLFYAFYGMPHDEMQLAAAGELYRRGWRYHMNSAYWFLADPDNPPEQHDTYLMGKFHCWDHQKWTRVGRDSMTLILDQLEGPPQLPAFMVPPEGGQA